jgi:hypothetical protein
MTYEEKDCTSTKWLGIYKVFLDLKKKCPVNLANCTSR